MRFHLVLVLQLPKLDDGFGKLMMHVAKSLSALHALNRFFVSRYAIIGEITYFISNSHFKHPYLLKSLPPWFVWHPPDGYLRHLASDGLIF